MEAPGRKTPKEPWSGCGLREILRLKPEALKLLLTYFCRAIENLRTLGTGG